MWKTLATTSLLLAASVPVLAAPDSVTARGVGPAPGAVVCRDLATVSAMVDWYAEAMEERLQAAVTGGASAQVDGQPLGAPDLARYGCALAKPGTPMTVTTADQAAAVVAFKMPNGKTFRGVTQSNMIESRAPAQ